MLLISSSLTGKRLRRTAGICRPAAYFMADSLTNRAVHKKRSVAYLRVVCAGWVPHDLRGRNAAAPAHRRCAIVWAAAQEGCSPHLDSEQFTPRTCPPFCGRLSVRQTDRRRQRGGNP